MTQQKHAALRYIAVYKFLKALGLLLVAVVVFGFVHTPWLEAAAKWVEELPIRSGHGILIRWTEQLLGLSPQRFEIIGIGACIYATLFAVEGWGLWRGKRWAEYLTVFATASLIPFEVWELARHVTPLKIAAIAVNVAIVVYLWRVVRRG